MRDWMRAWKSLSESPAAVFLMYPVYAAAVSVVFLSPFAPIDSLAGSIAYGDAVQFAFFQSWGHDTILSGDWSRFWQLPISHPLPSAGGLTDILPGLSLQTVWLRIFTDNPVLIYNLSTLLCGMLNVLGFIFLARTVGLARINGWQVIEFPLAGHPGWTATPAIEAIRIDFEDPSVTGSVYELGEVCFVEG